MPLLSNNAHAHRPPTSYLLEFKGYVRRVMGNVSSTTARLIEGLDGEDAIFFSLHPAQISGRLRKYLIILLDEKYTKAITDENWSRIWKIIERLENSLKADIGIFDLPVIGASPYHEDDVLLLDKIDQEIRALTCSDLSADRRTVIQEKQLFTF